MPRLSTIDFTRGLVMVIMALDHVRDLMHITALTQDPTDLSTTTPGLFLTRWITHLCAPTFVFLSGTSAYLSLKKSGNLTASRQFLRSRGLWLILLEFTLINFALWFDLQFRLLVMQVIAAIGFGLVVLSFVLKMPVRVVGLLGLVIVFGHNLLQGVAFDGPMGFLWAVLFRPGVFPVTPGFTFAVLYPLVPWLGILLAGYAAGPIFERALPQRRKTLLLLGVAALALFSLIRFTNFYGDPAPWKVQKEGLFTFLSFINCLKYPPSLLYTLMTLGVAFLILAAADGRENRFTRAVSVYGKVPLFYYLIHWYLIHSLMLALVVAQGFRWEQMPFGPFEFGRPRVGFGVELPGVYLIWAGVVLVLYPHCRWYGRYKAAHPEKGWLRYL
ncbi:MAG: DUF1624 domain-containing protein [Sphingobacteriaceae bacterium]|nr:DUF1624 domain-containing protein [Cytophagaceae bacterium]